MDSTKKPLFSILIATKNRIPYCINVIERILKYPDQDFELIIQDNSDSHELFDYAKKITDLRFVYNYTPPPFTSIENFNKVNGENAWQNQQDLYQATFKNTWDEIWVYDAQMSGD